MKKKLPILIIIPHGGYKIPEELEEYIQISKFDLLYSSDACANEIFSFENRVMAKIDTYISRLFVDVDRAHFMVPPASSDGVIKNETLSGKDIFLEGNFPDEIAISNIIKRYYLPFHQTVEKIINSKEIKLILECHTMMPVGARKSFDPGQPRPMLTVQNKINFNGKNIKVCGDDIAESFLENIKKNFFNENLSVVEKFAVNKPCFNGYILQKFYNKKIPMLRFFLSRALFFNDEYFNLDYLKIDDIRIKNLKEMVWLGIEKFAKKML